VGYDNSRCMGGGGGAVLFRSVAAWGSQRGSMAMCGWGIVASVATNRGMTH
jgi:hypothetical protein